MAHINPTSQSLHLLVEYCSFTFFFFGLISFFSTFRFLMKYYQSREAFSDHLLLAPAHLSHAPSLYLLCFYHITHLFVCEIIIYFSVFLIVVLPPLFL